MPTSDNTSLTIVIFSCSLRSQSHSRLLASASRQFLEENGVRVHWVDLRDCSLPLCDGEKAYEAPDVSRLKEIIEQSDAVVMAVPIYNYDVNAAAKNLIELTGRSWNDKVVGFLCAAGGRSSYMSVMAVATSLMLDFRCTIVPRFVYAARDAFSDGAISDEAIIERVSKFSAAMSKTATAIKQVNQEM